MKNFEWENEALIGDIQLIESMNHLQSLKQQFQGTHLQSQKSEEQELEYLASEQLQFIVNI
ncbi:MAG: hypothetical protein R3240_01175 [Gammaproteobacteria bacterium]|nr:hypothetical protein [Gammaproteobacteria bacterium]